MAALLLLLPAVCGSRLHLGASQPPHRSMLRCLTPSSPPARPQIGVLLVAVEIYRKNKEDTQKKARELVERQQIRDLHERHLQSEQVGLGGRVARGLDCLLCGAVRCMRPAWIPPPPMLTLRCLLPARCALGPAARRPSPARPPAGPQGASGRGVAAAAQPGREAAVHGGGDGRRWAEAQLAAAVWVKSSRPMLYSTPVIAPLIVELPCIFPPVKFQPGFGCGDGGRAAAAWQAAQRVCA